MSDRLATSVFVSGLIRKAEAEGGFAALLAKGDPSAGSIIVILVERGQPRVFERILQASGNYAWHDTGGDEANEVAAFVARRRRFDPDLWVLELDIPSAERFAAEMNGLD